MTDKQGLASSQVWMAAGIGSALLAGHIMLDTVSRFHRAGRPARLLLGAAPFAMAGWMLSQMARPLADASGLPSPRAAATAQAGEPGRRDAEVVAAPKPPAGRARRAGGQAARAPSPSRNRESVPEVVAAVEIARGRSPSAVSEPTRSNRRPNRAGGGGAIRGGASDGARGAARRRRRRSDADQGHRAEAGGAAERSRLLSFRPDRGLERGGAGSGRRGAGGGAAVGRRGTTGSGRRRCSPGPGFIEPGVRRR